MVTGNAPITFGERLAHAMASRRLGTATIPELARECNVSYQAVKKWIASADAKLEARSALKAATFLGVNYLWLVEGIGPMRGSERLTDHLQVMEDLASYQTSASSAPSGLTTQIQAYLSGLDPVLLPSARAVLHRLVDGEIADDEAWDDLERLQAMSAQAAHRKPTGTG